ncbi:Hsp70 family protein [Haliangium ochraceum]|uniref:Molecular chaperone n=1 Tax=Haliangium ochraceum (strain DSM 14365 / JCM 11303 / SMP-2) TaxID=502025 RepID=D0LGP6_HALO1|nr:Hsp70 family protein [Haliangium ochraceum]ACY12792.1 molecular chaperone [Haliangium ochraceum DSM 14365]
MSAARYVVGIDLGTTNCAVAYAELAAASERPDGLAGALEPFAIPQLVAPGEVAERPTLPSFLLLPTAHELAPEAMSLPWAGAPGFAVGELARERGAELPQRVVASAKSWLSHTGVDRNAAILPWRGAVSGEDGSGDGEGEAGRVSPVEASTRYLAHVRAAWDAAHPESPLAEQEVLLTVPASFDAVARELTAAAARQAGLLQVTLLEEPQAAFYAWLAEHGGGPDAAPGSDWREQLAAGDVVLVCDLGGGTTDFSLIAVQEDEGGTLALERVAVGDHILLGGDNVDLALAHVVSQRLGGKAKKLKQRQQRALVHACRRAKETLLGADAPDSVPISILGAGSRLIGGTLRSEVLQSDIDSLVLGGFFPEVAADAEPQSRRTVGLVELGLSYAQDAAVTRHLASFLSRHGRAPSAVLFNGGVMKSQRLQERVAAILRSWQPEGSAPLRVLSGTSLDLAVAHGAAYYGLVRRGAGIRIRGGTARAYYIGVESAMPAIPGFPPPIKALCVAPFGMEEGSAVDLPGEELGLVVGETAEFRFFASSERKDDHAGTICDPDEEELRELDPVETTLPPFTEGGAEHAAGDTVPVNLRALITEIGTLELWCVTRDRAHQWKLEYSVRDAED